ncbi:ALG14, UDP-N-acetylglucosaminyltransferase subunit [Anticarsia gemmatalis]|uniref:ALG14, UDP-N-acetylglucosaminyltransferase subunit n=1 Tax=Anticarsia gemmatalis TaxID=129554 RepID=UPI003F7756B4
MSLLDEFHIFSQIFCLSLVIFMVVRVIYLLYKIFTSQCGLSSTKPLRTIICIGSGGHTTEMLRLVKSMNMTKYNPRMYVLADNDESSEVKIHEAEKDHINYRLSRIPRSRNVQQPYLSSIWSTLYAIGHAIPILLIYRPNVIFCNGPGTCIPICLVAFFMRCAFLMDCRIVFIESICRVRSLSLTGRILEFFADLIIVQWPELRDACYRAKYFGRLT